jgi:serine/threonine protein kinase
VPTEAPDSPTSFALRTGAVIADRFRIVRPLATGSAYAITYLADDLTRGEPIVVKEFFPRGLVARAPDGIVARPHSPESGRDFVRALRRFVIEGSVLSEIAHPHVVRARGLVEANGTAYLVMDQHHSQPLAEYLRINGGRLTPSAAARIIQHLLTALEPLHAESVIHRDLSPRSVHVQGDGSVLLLEFSARRHLPLHATDLASGFAAFEQYGMRDIGPWTDVYAVSALLYYLLTGVTPPSALDRAAGEALQSPTSLVPGLAPGLPRLVMRGMSLLPQQRPHVASELRRQIETSLAESSQPSTRAPQSSFATDALAAMSDRMNPDGEGGAGTLKLAAGGIVLPGEERSSGLLRRLGNAASRFRRTPVTAPAEAPLIPREPRTAPERTEMERRATPVAEAAPVPVEMPLAAPSAPPPNDVPVAEAPRPTPQAALMPIDERALPTVDERLRALDIAAQLTLAESSFDAMHDGPDHRRRYSLMAAAALVVAIGGSLAFLARSSSASSGGMPEGARQTAGVNTPTPTGSTSQRTSAVNPHEVVEAGAVMPSVPHVDSSAGRTPAVSPKPRVSEPVERKAAPSPAPRAQPSSPTPLPSGKLPTVNVAIASPSTDLKIVTPEMLVDARTRLTNGQDAADQGDYLLARRAFKGALLQLDSIATRFPESEKVRALRHDVEQADAHAVQACNAENEMRKRRGEPGKPCQ